MADDIGMFQHAISANGDQAIGTIIAEAVEKVGKDGVITVEEGQDAGNDARHRRGHAVRSRISLGVLRDLRQTCLTPGDGDRYHRRCRPGRA